MVNLTEPDLILKLEPSITVNKEEYKQMICLTYAEAYNEKKRLEKIVERLETMSKKANLTIHRIRRLKYSKIAPSVQLIRDIEKGITFLERNNRIHTSYRLRRFIMRSTQEVLNNIENRLTKLEQVIDSKTQE